MDEMKQINLSLGLSTAETSLLTKIQLYKKRAQEVEKYLNRYPEEWGRFQYEFNTEVDNIFRDIMIYEKINLSKGNIEKVYKLKKLFINKIRKLFMRRDYSEWSIKKPLGYAGDYKIIDEIYRNDPQTTGFNRLFDNYYQMSAICVGVRNRKNDFKKILYKFISKKPKKSIRIMNLACGSCREILELLSQNSLPNKNITFDCYDNDERALEYAKNSLKKYSNINFIKENALRLSATKQITLRIKKKYDIVYTTGLFDYLNNRIAARLIENLKILLKINGILVVANVRDKYSNPSVHYMEWAGDWNLIYRSGDEFKKLFLNAGFKNDDLHIRYEQQGIMQYIIATNTRNSNNESLSDEFK
ncbi:MAG: methyltransferase domain-containing protein [Omnitrophica bacterium]|nr:methyltransferase domain-containing protein [Candidatus Omnitrophota bacterium]